MTLDLSQIMTYLVYVGIAIGLILNFYVVKRLGKGIMNIVFISFGMSLLLVGLAMAFVAVYESRLQDISFHVFWHSIIYLAFISLIWGGYRIKKNMESANPEGFNVKDTVLFANMLLWSVFIFVIAPVVDQSLYSMLTGSFVETIGLHHLIAFVLGIIGAWYLFYIKGGPQAGKSMRFISIYLLFLGIQHFWEIINETLHLLPITGETTELVEKFIILGAIIFFILGQSAVIKFIKGKN